jgi:hypothetical protein
MGLVMLATVTVCSPLAAQSTSPPSSPIVLQIPASVRFAGLNGAGAALVGHAGTVFTNPAGLATISHVALEGAYLKAPFDQYIAAAALGWRLRQFDLGAGLQYYDLGSTGPNASSSGSRDNELLGVGSLVYRFGLIALGMSGKYVRQTIGGNMTEGAGVDAGLAIAVFDIMALGFSVQNIGGNLQAESPIPMRRVSRFGFTMNYVDPQETFRLLSTLEVQWPAGLSNRFVFGVESGVVVSGVGLIGRVGYGSRPSQGTDRKTFTFGATVELSRLKVDFAYEPYGLSDERTQRIGVRLAL